MLKLVVFSDLLSFSSQLYFTTGIAFGWQALFETSTLHSNWLILKQLQIRWSFDIYTQYTQYAQTYKMNVFVHCTQLNQNSNYTLTLRRCHVRNLSDFTTTENLFGISVFSEWLNANLAPNQFFISIFILILSKQRKFLDFTIRNSV